MTTQSTTTFSRGDVAVVNFLYADQRGWKHRPALVLSTDEYHARRGEVILAALTSNVSRNLPGDTLLKEWSVASLPRPSVVTAILRSVKRGEVLRTLGALTASDLQTVDSNFRRALGL